LASVHLLLGGGPAHGAAGAVAGAGERELARFVAAGEDVGTRAHAPGDEDGLAKAPVAVRELLGGGAECARRSLAVHAEDLVAVALQLGDVVGHVVDGAQIAGAIAEVLAEDVLEGQAYA